MHRNKAGVVHCRPDQTKGVGRQVRVGMEKQQDVTGCESRAAVHLTGAPFTAATVRTPSSRIALIELPSGSPSTTMISAGPSASTSRTC